MIHFGWNASPKVPSKWVIRIALIQVNDFQKVTFTGKSFSEAIILASTNPQYDKRLFIELQVQYMKTTSSEHVVYINYSECQNKKHVLNL